MSWNYRAVRRGEEIGIYSVYYDKDEHIEGISVDPSYVSYFSVEQIGEHLDLMREALQKPILEYEAGAIPPDEFMCLLVERAELIEGYVAELPHRMLREAALIGAIGSILLGFVRQKNLGKVAAGGSFLTGAHNVRIPAASFLSNEDLRGENTDDIIRKAPTLAVEIATPAKDHEDKAAEFLRAGSRAVWIVNPRRRSVAVHTPDNIAITYQMGDAIPGGEILPGFELPIADIFED